jgi:hypothetical protein
MIDVLGTLKAELDECVTLLRPHYPDEPDEALRHRAVWWRGFRYLNGRWPTDQEIEARVTDARMVIATRASFTLTT